MQRCNRKGRRGCVLGVLRELKYAQPLLFSILDSDAANKTCERERDFCIRHFAGDVVYDTNGFVEKNNDSLFHDLSRVLYSSSNQFLQSMWPEGADKVRRARPHRRILFPCYRSALNPFLSHFFSLTLIP